MRCISRTTASIVICAGAVTAAATQAAAATQPPARPAPKPVTIRFFAEQVYSRLSDSNGRALPAGSVPIIGDRVSYASEGYAGNHLRHSVRATTADETNCTVVTDGSILCDGAIAIRGTMILADDFVLRFPAKSPTTTIRITGGTGAYTGARGTITARAAGRGLDVTVLVTLRRPSRARA